MGARTWRVRPSMRWIWRLARWSASPCRTPMRATRRRASTRRRREREPVERGEQRVVGRGAPRQPPTRAARRAPSPCPARPPRAPASCPPPPSRAPAAPRSGGNGRHSPGAATPRPRPWDRCALIDRLVDRCHMITKQLPYAAAHWATKIARPRTTVAAGIPVSQSPEFRRPIVRPSTWRVRTEL